MKKLFTKDIFNLKIDYYSVTEEEMEELDCTDPDSLPPVGMCLPREQVVYIREDQHTQQFFATTWHETLEAINHFCDIGLTHHQILLLEGACLPFITFKNTGGK